MALEVSGSLWKNSSTATPTGTKGAVLPGELPADGARGECNQAVRTGLEATPALRRRALDALSAAQARFLLSAGFLLWLVPYMPLALESARARVWLTEAASSGSGCILCSSSPHPSGSSSATSAEPC